MHLDVEDHIPGGEEQKDLSGPNASGRRTILKLTRRVRGTNVSTSRARAKPCGGRDRFNAVVLRDIGGAVRLDVEEQPLQVDSPPRPLLGRGADD